MVDPLVGVIEQPIVAGVVGNHVVVARSDKPEQSRRPDAREERSPSYTVCYGARQKRWFRPDSPTVARSSASHVAEGQFAATAPQVMGRFTYLTLKG